MQVVEAAYSEAVHWRQNLFKIPFGHAGKEFVAGLACLFRSYAEASALEPIALKAAILLPLLMLLCAVDCVHGMMGTFTALSGKEG